VGEQARSSSRRTSEEGGQLGCLGGIHYREDLVSRLQDEVRAWDQELTTADDRRQCTLIRQWQVTEGVADCLGPGMYLLFYQSILPLAQLEQCHHVTWALRRTRALRPSSAMSKRGAQTHRNNQFCGGKGAVSKRRWSTGT
jgi:hypothetical protein